MIIKSFKIFNESYLRGSRQPLYHITRSIYTILKGDILKSSKPSRPSHGKIKSISLTRNIDFTSDNYIAQVIEIDVDKLLNDGIKSYPVDEISWEEDGTINKSYVSGKRNLSKSGFNEFKKGTRGTKHNLDLPKKYHLEYEFEERVFQNIEKLGKYIISLNFTKDTFLKDEIEIIRDYLNKYPHIVIKIIDKDNRRKSSDITYKFSEIEIDDFKRLKSNTF